MGDDPPCDECEKPKLTKWDSNILHYWRSLDGDRQIVDGMLLPIPTISIITFLYQFDEGVEALELILDIDREYISVKNNIEKQRRERERQKRQAQAKRPQRRARR